ncbi:MAG: hypothetical protein LKE85_05390 [Lachnospiraceae bacterium]|nr:hypothetical protein [Lachnospiraceae bacterium]
MAGTNILKDKFTEELRGRSSMSDVLHALLETDVFACLHAPTEDDYLDFLGSFEEDFPNVEEILQAYEDRWGIPPGVILTGQEIREKKEILHYKKLYEEYPVETRYRIRTLVEYCIEKPAERSFVFNYGDGVCQVFALRPVIARDTVRHCVDLVDSMVCRMVDFGGEFLFTYRTDKTAYVNGFLSANRQLYMADRGRIRSMLYTCVNPQESPPITAEPEVPNLVIAIAGVGSP